MFVISPLSLRFSQVTQPETPGGSVVRSLLLPSDLTVQLTSHLAGRRAVKRRGAGCPLPVRTSGPWEEQLAGGTSATALPATKTSDWPGSFACQDSFT